MAEQMLTYEQYKEAGFSDADIQKFLRPKLEEAGFSKTEVSQYFYQQSGDARLSYLGVETNKNIKDMAKYIADAQYKASLEGKNLNAIDAIKLGWEQSVTGMLARGEMPTELTEEQASTLNFFERTLMGMSSVVSDIPVYFAGGKLGAAGGAAVGTIVPGVGNVVGAAVGGAAGAFGIHAAARQMLIDMYTRGEVASWDELMTRVGNATKEFAKGAAVGVVTAGAAKVGQVAKTALAGSTMARAQTAVGNIVNVTAKTMPYGAEVLGLTSASSLVEGHVPTAQDFVDNAVLIASLKGVNKVSDYGAAKIKNKAIDYLYSKFVTEGKSPATITKEVQSNPKTLEEIVKDDGKLISIDKSEKEASNKKPLQAETEKLLEQVPSIEIEKDTAIDTMAQTAVTETSTTGKVNKQKKPSVFNTPEFKNWFGDGILKNNKGTPIKVYHATSKNNFEDSKTPFRSFKPSEFSGNLIFVTPSKEYIEMFVDKVHKTDYALDGYYNPKDHYTYTLYTNIKKPFDVSSETDIRKVFSGKPELLNDALAFAKKLKENPDTYMTSPNEYLREEAPMYEEANVTALIKNAGYDAIKTKEFGETIYALFDPKALKSVKNKGTFSTETDDIFAKAFPGYTTIPRPKGRTVLPSKGPVDINNALKKSDIFNKLAKAAEIPVRLGKVGVRGAEGVYKPKAEAIRIKNANDITTLAHEIGHHYEKLTFGRTASAGIAKYYDELSRIATRPAGKPNANRIAAEGFAEFIAKYIVNPAQAKEVAPKFYEVFEKEIAPRAPELHKAMLAAREDVAKYYAQPLAYEVLGAISNRPREGLSNREKWEEIKYNFVRNWLDDKNPIKYAVEKVEQAAGIKLSFDKNAYFLSRMFPGWSGKAEAFLEHKPFSFKDLKDIEGSKSLREIVKSVENWDEFTAYLVSARALELNARGIKTGIDIFAAKATERQLKKKYGALANDLYKYQDALLKYQLDGGLISKEVYDAIKAENQKYIPFYREFEKAQGSAIGSRSMKSKQTVKRIKGSTRDIINPLESIIKNTFEMINAVERNRVGLAYADMSRLDKSAMFVEKIPLPKTVVHSPKGTDAGERAEIFFSNTSKLGKDEILVYRDGKPEAYRVDPDVAAIINGTQSMTQRFEALNFLKFFTKTLRAGATGMNATFAVKNLIRDNFFAYMSSKAGYRPFVDSLQNAKIAITKDEAYWELKKAGGSQSSFVSVDRNALQKKISDFTDTGYFNAIWNRLKEVRNSDGSINYKQTMSKIGEALDRALDPLVLISETSELSTRIGEFRRSMKGKEWTKENIEKAGYNSREVTLDFAKGGAYSKAYNQFKAFFNANILGAEKSIDILTNKKSAIKAVWTMGMLGIFTALANYDWGNGQEDQDIKEVLQAQKDTNWVLKVWGTDTIIRIPKPQQIGFISTIFEQLTTDTLNALNGAEREDIIQHLYQAFMRELSIPTTWGDIGQAALPTAFTPVLENWANRSMYFGTSIVPASAENALPEYQYTDRTTELSKAISSALGVFIGKTNTFSPAKMENVVRGWTGGVGNYIMEMVDLAARKAGIVPDPVRPADTLADIPFVRAFIARHPSSTSSSVQKWYEESAKRMQYLKSYSIAGKNFDEESMEDLAKYQVYKALNPIQNAMNQVTRQIRTIYKLPDMSADDKRQTIDSLYLVKIQLAKQGLQTIRNLDKAIMS